MALDFLELNQGLELLTKALQLVQDTLVSGAEEFAKYEKQLDAVGRAAGLSGESLKQFGESLDELSKATGTSKDQLLELAKAAAQVGQTGDKLLPFVTTMNKISQALGLSGDQAVHTFESFKNLFGVSSSDAEKFANALQGVAKNAGISVDQVTSAAQSLGSIAREFNFTGTQAAALGASLEKLGIDAGSGGIAVSRILNGITENADKFAKVLGLDANELRTLVANDSFAALQKFSGAFENLSQAQRRAAANDLGLGNIRLAKTLDALAASTQNVTKLVKDGNDSFDHGTQTADKFAAAQAELATKLTKLQQAASELNVHAFAPFVDVLKKVVDGTTDFLTRAAGPVEEFFKSLVEPTQIAIEAIKVFATRMFEATGRVVDFFSKTVGIASSAHDFATLFTSVLDGLDRLITFVTGGKSQLASYYDQAVKNAHASRDAAAAEKEHADSIKKTSDEASTATTTAQKALSTQEQQLKGALAGAASEVSAYNEAQSKTSAGLAEQINNENNKLKILQQGLAVNKNDQTIRNAIQAIEFKINQLQNQRLKTLQDETKINRDLANTRAEVAKIEEDIAGKTGDSTLAIEDANRKIQEQKVALTEADTFHNHALEIELETKRKIAATDEQILANTKKQTQGALDSARQQQIQTKESFDAFLAQQRAALQPDGVAKNIRQLGDSFKQAFKAGIPSQADLSEALGLFDQNVNQNIKKAESERQDLLKQRNDTAVQFNQQIAQLQDQLSHTKNVGERQAIQQQINQLVAQAQQQVAGFDQQINKADDGLKDARDSAESVKKQLQDAGAAGVETAKRMAEQTERLAEAAERAARAFEKFAQDQAAQNGGGTENDKKARALQVQVDQLQDLLNTQKKRLTEASSDAEKAALEKRIAETETQLSISQGLLSDAKANAAKEHKATADAEAAAAAQKSADIQKQANIEAQSRQSEVEKQKAEKDAEESKKKLDDLKDQLGKVSQEGRSTATQSFNTRNKAENELDAAQKNFDEKQAAIGSSNLTPQQIDQLRSQQADILRRLADLKPQIDEAKVSTRSFDFEGNQGVFDNLKKQQDQLSQQFHLNEQKLAPFSDLDQAGKQLADARENFKQASEQYAQSGQKTVDLQKQVADASADYADKLAKVKDATDKASSSEAQAAAAKTQTGTDVTTKLQGATQQQDVVSQLGTVTTALGDTTASQTALATNLDKFSNSLNDVLAAEKDLNTSVDALNDAVTQTLKNISETIKDTSKKVKDISKNVDAVDPKGGKSVSDASGLPATFGSDVNA